MVENLNLMTRQELVDTQKHMVGDAFIQLKSLLNSEPAVRGMTLNLDQYLIAFNAAVISEISYALEGYTWEQAEDYASKLERGVNTPEDDEHHRYWQVLQEKWGYLEVASGS